MLAAGAYEMAGKDKIFDQKTQGKVLVPLPSIPFPPEAAQPALPDPGKKTREIVLNNRRSPRLYDHKNNNMITTDIKSSLKTEKEFKHAVVFTVKGAPGVAVVQATAGYIPIDHFKEIFNYIETIIRGQSINKLVFDKHKLTVFHQPSMEWYFIEWKERMFSLGLKTHRKILPQDRIFRESVKIGREKINKLFPNGKYRHMDIQYSETLEEAISN
jgi:hypothetical protein